MSSRRLFTRSRIFGSGFPTTTTTTTTTTAFTTPTRRFLSPAPSSQYNQSQLSYNQRPRLGPVKTNQAYRRLISPTQTAHNLITANMSSSTTDQDPSSQKEAAGQAEAAAAAAETIREEPAAPALPPLTDHEFKQYNRLAEHMDYFVSLSLCLSLYFYFIFYFLFFVIRRLNPPPPQFPPLFFPSPQGLDLLLGFL